MPNHQNVSSGTSLTVETANFLFSGVYGYNKIINLKYQGYYVQRVYLKVILREEKMELGNGESG